MTQSQLVSQQSHYRILVVDDDSVQRKMENGILSIQGFDMVEAESGEEAPKNIKEKNFDAVLLDKNMSGMSGDEICQAVRQWNDFSLLPLIVVTGAGSAQDIAVSFASGAMDFLRKPYSSTELVARITTVVKNKKITEQMDSVESLMFAMAHMVEAKDECTGDHCHRLSHSAVAFGRVLGLGVADLLALRRAGVRHDIGKLDIPDSVLLKRTPLTDEEWMEQHSIIGALLCRGIKTFERTILIIRSHHECWGGGGYPGGLQGEGIPLLARVFQMVDICDALSNDRPYKKAFPLNDVISVMQGECDKGCRDPQLSKRFIDILKTRPQIFTKSDAYCGDIGAEPFQNIQKFGINQQDEVNA